MKRYAALVIEVDFSTGRRAGDIDPRDPGLICMPLWQDLEKGVELRLILDDRPLEQYRNLEGVELVEGKEAINAKIKELFKPRYSIVAPELLRESIHAKNIPIDDIDHTLPPEKQVEILYKRGALGIRKQDPFRLE